MALCTVRVLLPARFGAAQRLQPRPHGTKTSTHVPGSECATSTGVCKSQGLLRCGVDLRFRVPVSRGLAPSPERIRPATARRGGYLQPGGHVGDRTGGWRSECAGSLVSVPPRDTLRVVGSGGVALRGPAPRRPGARSAARRAGLAESLQTPWDRRSVRRERDLRRRLAFAASQRARPQSRQGADHDFGPLRRRGEWPPDGLDAWAIRDLHRDRGVGGRNRGATRASRIRNDLRTRVRTQPFAALGLRDCGLSQR